MPFELVESTAQHGSLSPVDALALLAEAASPLQGASSRISLYERVLKESPQESDSRVAAAWNLCSIGEDNGQSMYDRTRALHIAVSNTSQQTTVGTYVRARLSSMESLGHLAL